MRVGERRRPAAASPQPSFWWQRSAGCDRLANMNTTAPPTVEARLASLERSARRWRAGCAALLAVGVGALVLGADKPPPASFDTLRVKRLEVANDDGKVVGTLSALDGEGMLILNNKAGKTAVGLGAVEAGGILTIHNNSGTKCIMLTGGDDTGGRISLRDTFGKEVQSIPAGR